MSKCKVLRTIELILQVVTIISSILAIVSIVKNYKYKSKLREKAQVYLDEELGEFQDVERKVSVFSPEVEEQEGKIKKLLLVASASLISLFVIRVLKRD